MPNYKFYLQAISLPLVVALFASCAAKSVPLSAADKAALRGKSIVISTRGMPNFAVMTPSTALAAGLGGAVGGAIAGGVATSVGNGNIKEYRVSNPNELIAQPLARHLATSSGAKINARPQQVLKGKSSGAISKTYPGSDYVMDVMTKQWSGFYRVSSMGKYEINYRARMRLIEVNTGRIIADGTYIYKDNKTAAADYDAIYANDAVYLKSETKKATSGALSMFTNLLR